MHLRGGGAGGLGLIFLKRCDEAGSEGVEITGKWNNCSCKQGTAVLKSHYGRDTKRSMSPVHSKLLVSLCGFQLVGNSLKHWYQH